MTGIGHHPIIFNLAQKPLFHPPYNHLFKLVAPLMKVARNIPLKCKGTLAPIPTKNWNTPIQFHGLLALAPPRGKSSMIRKVVLGCNWPESNFNCVISYLK